LAAVSGRTLGLYRRMGLVLGRRRRRGRLGLGHLPLRPLGVRPRIGLGLDSRRRMGSGLGDLASRRAICRVGAAAPGRYGRSVLGRSAGLAVRAIAQLDCAADHEGAAASGAANDLHQPNRGGEPYGQPARSRTSHRREPRNFGISDHGGDQDFVTYG
jgi:hypothetical protein